MTMLTDLPGLVVTGVSGRMGQMLVRTIAASDRARLVGAVGDGAGPGPTPRTRDDTTVAAPTEPIRRAPFPPRSPPRA